jgi:hypothetical protein
MPNDLNFLDALSESLGVSLAFREDLTCCLSTPEGFEIQIESAPEQDAIVFTAALGPVPAGDERLLRHLLAANFLFQGTRGESVGLEESTDRAMLCRQFSPSRLSPAQGVELFRQFADTATRWRQHLAEGPDTTTPANSATEALLRA